MWNLTAITFIAIAIMECSKAATTVNAYVAIPDPNRTRNNVRSDAKDDGPMNSRYRRHSGYKDEEKDYEKKEKNTLEHCDILNKEYSTNRTNLTVLINEHPYKLIVKSTERAPSKAAAAIIATILKYGLGYNNVFIDIDNRNNCELATTLNKYFEQTGEVIIHVDADWKGPEENCPVFPQCPHNWDRTCSVAGPRLMVIGATPGVNIRLHAALRSSANLILCNKTYSKHNFKKCGFLDRSENDSTGCIPVLIPPDVKVPHELNLTDIDGIKLCQHPLSNRSELVHLLTPPQSPYETKTNPFLGKSFFFIDYDFYSDNEIVKNAYMPIRYTSDVTALRVTDYLVLRQYAPLIVDILNNTTPRSTQLREIVDLNANLQDFEQATCAWANKHKDTFKNWTNTIKIKPWIAIFICNDLLHEKINDKNHPGYDKLIDTMNQVVTAKFKHILSFDLKYGYLNCSNRNELNNIIANGKAQREWQWQAGVVASGEVVEASIDICKNSNMQMVVYDVPLTRFQLNDGIISSTGSQTLLARAICHFFKQHGWHRIAIISDRTSLAEDLLAELKAEKSILYLPKYIEKVNNLTNIDEVLADIKEANARIIFVNTASDIANLIACKATAIGMNLKSKYAWIAREWRPAQCYNDLRIFTISYDWRGQYPMPNDTGGDKAIYSMIEKGLEGLVWPSLVVSLADAILLIVHRVIATVIKRPKLLYDLHGKDVTRTMASLTENNTGIGVLQSLKLHNHTRANPLIYVNVWSGANITSLGIWKGISDSQEIVEVTRASEMNSETIPKDGSSRSCMVQSGDPFTPRCDDAIWICSFFTLLLAFFAVWFAIQRQKKQIRKRERDTLMRLLTRCEKTASVLSSYLVERSTLDLQEELGYGHFGRVRFGLLRLVNRRSTPIAAKALRKDAAPAEEAEFLREASTLAGLSHAHIIGFVGICADTDGPPLLLMEHAFFGDLLRYLRARRHLAVTKDEDLDEVNADYEKRNNKCVEEEECYVSALELTRLAREAALALAYLKERHLVHRDVRAANCLVDTKRSLKLADFGMARRVGGNAQSDNLGEELEPSSDYQYICRRRGVFPVPWMAPESLDRGEFSHASDVWALGVLILEVATLGARPFGVWRPLTVLRYVRKGGRPPLPIDASYNMTEVTEMCWADLPKRATASEVYDYLKAHPTAIRAALRPAWPELDVSPDVSDSGFGDTHADHDWTNDLRVSTM